MDMRKCGVCEVKFDYDKSGLGCGRIVVCSAACAEKSAASRGNAVAVHDRMGRIVRTNVDGTETRHIF